MTKMTFKQVTLLNTATASTEDLISARNVIQKETVKEQVLDVVKGAAMILGGGGLLIGLSVTGIAPLTCAGLITLCASGAIGLSVSDKKEKFIETLRTQVNTAIDNAFERDARFDPKEVEALVDARFTIKLREFFANAKNDNATAVTPAPAAEKTATPAHKA